MYRDANDRLSAMGGFSRQMLTDLHYWGCNALGIFELAACALPNVLLGVIVEGASMQPGEAAPVAEAVARGGAIFMAGVAAVFDLRWRWREEPDPMWWIKAFSHEAGGALMFFPGWMLCGALLALQLYVVIALPETPSPYAR